MRDSKSNGHRFTETIGGHDNLPPTDVPKHKRLLAALVAEKTVDRLALLTIADLWVLADEIHKLDEDLCRRMAWALGKRVCDSSGDEPR